MSSMDILRHPEARAPRRMIGKDDVGPRPSRPARGPLGMTAAVGCRRGYFFSAGFLSAAGAPAAGAAPGAPPGAPPSPGTTPAAAAAAPAAPAAAAAAA